MGTTLFKEVGYSLGTLMDNIMMGTIGLPDIQRPFVWKNKKVRDLFDSMFRGYPVGYLLFWENQLGDKTKQIGTGTHQKIPSILIVDGQQRLTALYAVLRAIPVVRDNYQTEQIEIAFKPTDGTFEVCDAAIRKNPEFIPNISVLFAADASQYRIVGDYIEQVSNYREKNGKTFSPDERKSSEQALQRLFSLTSYPFTTLELAAGIEEEQVAEVFVRINSKGKTLNQADFILTLMSVFWEEGRRELEAFCRASRIPSDEGPSPFNHFVKPSPDQLLRVAVGTAFRRARLKSAYSVLRGKDMDTEEFSDEQREKQFNKLKAAQANVLNLIHWHDYLGILKQSGFTGANLINSETTVYYAYILYLIGRIDLKVNPVTLGQVIGRWFFMATITSRYTEGSPETLMERDLAALRSVTTSDTFLAWIEREMSAELTRDFWKVTLPARLETSSAVSPLLYAYMASLNLFDARVLFSKKRTRDVMDPAINSPKSAVERHHLYPKSYLAELGVKDIRETNQIANYALIEWNDNIAISDSPPSEYFPQYWSRLTPKEQADQSYWHALPEGWHEMEYSEFLVARRQAISAVIHDGLDRLTHGERIQPEEDTIENRISRGEGMQTEFKSTLRRNCTSGNNDTRMEHAVLKTIAAFLNSHGGTLLIGVQDDGQVVGVEQDSFQNEDKMGLHLDNLIRDRLGGSVFSRVKSCFKNASGKRVLVVECESSDKPIFLKNDGGEEFYIRAGASSPALPASQTHEYIQQHFK